MKYNLKNNNFSKYNAMELWVKPDGKGQKLVVQIATESGEEFEVYLTELMKQKKAQYVTIPFSSFKGKNGGTLDTSKITKFAIWCNSIVPEGHEGKFHVESSIYFDGIKAVKASKKLLKEVNKDGLIYEKSSK
ncbi:MAG TPA: CIA30 family protein [Candidatus Scybalomonas excrementigallinarum]|nr:CIA30 family protein [Candidatus Scybalomonas excrementigallinarum]